MLAGFIDNTNEKTTFFRTDFVCLHFELHNCCC